MKPYSDRLAQRLIDMGSAAVVTNAGVSGELAKFMPARLPPLLNRKKAALKSENSCPFDLVLILAGTNDLPSCTPHKLIEHITNLHRIAHRAGARTGLLTIPMLDFETPAKSALDIDADRLAVNAALKKFVNNNRSRTFLIDLAEQIPQDEANREFWEPDGVHFSAKGYEAIGDMIADARWPDWDVASEVTVSRRSSPVRFTACWWAVGGYAMMVILAFARNVLSRGSTSSDTLSRSELKNYPTARRASKGE